MSVTLTQYCTLNDMMNKTCIWFLRLEVHDQGAAAAAAFVLPHDVTDRLASRQKKGLNSWDKWDSHNSCTLLSARPESSEQDVHPQLPPRNGHEGSGLRHVSASVSTSNNGNCISTWILTNSLRP